MIRLYRALLIFPTITVFTYKHLECVPCFLYRVWDYFVRLIVVSITVIKSRFAVKMALRDESY